ncbi:hypothetical protein [Phyllobacterium sp. CCNWLW109]|uniref:hypothetical protein n=1 Tax=Phyllobacterium sp. CCNWLW109 TaxID=3127479 RepID=UPI0030777B73
MNPIARRLRDAPKLARTHRPDVAMLNTGYAMVVGIEGGIITGTQDVLPSTKPYL